MRVRTVSIVALGLAALLCSHCGTDISAESPNRLYGAEGQSFVLEDIGAIVNDRHLTDDQKRSQLRDLGIEDEDLIEALLTL
jgi:hypothetical protein